MRYVLYDDDDDVDEASCGARRAHATFNLTIPAPFRLGGSERESHDNGLGSRFLSQSVFDVRW